MIPTLATLAALLYVAAGMLATRPVPRVAAARLPYVAALALLLHGYLLFHQAFPDGTLSLGVTEALSVFAWQAAALLWLFCLAEPLAVLGAALYPLSAAALLCATAWPSAGAGIPLHEWKLQLHVVLSLLSAGLLTLAAAQAVTLAWQDRALHRYGGGALLQALPPLQTMETALFRLISMGFFLLSLALVTGLLFVDDLLAQHLAHKTALSVAAWLILGGLLWGRWRRGWRGRKAVRWTLSGYAVLILAYFGTKFVLEEILGRHWS